MYISGPQIKKYLPELKLKMKIPLFTYEKEDIHFKYLKSKLTVIEQSTAALD